MSVGLHQDSYKKKKKKKKTRNRLKFLTLHSSPHSSFRLFIRKKKYTNVNGHPDPEFFGIYYSWWNYRIQIRFKTVHFNTHTHPHTHPHTPLHPPHTHKPQNPDRIACNLLTTHSSVLGETIRGGSRICQKGKPRSKRGGGAGGWYNTKITPKIT